MMQLVLTVLAIGLAALLAVGGINYFSTDIGIRVEISQSLKAQHDSIAGAVSSYKVANNGFVPRDLNRLSGYLPNGEVPSFPRSNQPFEWVIEKPVSGGDFLCLRRTGGTPGRGVMEGIVSFAKSQVSIRPGSLSYGSSCAAAAAADGSEGIDGLDVQFIDTHPGAAIAIRGS